MADIFGIELISQLLLDGQIAVQGGLHELLLLLVQEHVVEQRALHIHDGVGDAYVIFARIPVADIGTEEAAVLLHDLPLGSGFAGELGQGDGQILHRGRLEAVKAEYQQGSQHGDDQDAEYRGDQNVDPLGGVHPLAQSQSAGGDGQQQDAREDDPTQEHQPHGPQQAQQISQQRTPDDPFEPAVEGVAGDEFAAVHCDPRPAEPEPTVQHHDAVDRRHKQAHAQGGDHHGGAEGPGGGACHGAPVHEELHEENANQQKLAGEEMPDHGPVDVLQPLALVRLQGRGVGVLVAVDVPLGLGAHTDPARLGAEVRKILLLFRGPGVEGGGRGGVCDGVAHLLRLAPAEFPEQVAHLFRMPALCRQLGQLLFDGLVVIEGGVEGDILDIFHFGSSFSIIRS